MNKEELMRKMREAGLNCKAIKYASQFDKGYNNGIAYAINLLDKLDEPEIPEVPQFVADWFEDREHNLELHVSNLCVNAQRYPERVDRKVLNWYNNLENEPIQTLVKMKLYGYTIKKEKLYTAKLKLTNEYLHYDKGYKKFHHYAVHEDWANKKEEFHFTEDDLTKYNAWENEAYEVKEVKE